MTFFVLRLLGPVPPPYDRAEYDRAINGYHWKKVVRPAAMTRAHRRCESLGCRMRHDLSVHHKRYKRGGRSILGRERLSDVMVYCPLHHARADRRRRLAERILYWLGR